VRLTLPFHPLPKTPFFAILKAGLSEPYLRQTEKEIRLMTSQLIKKALKVALLVLKITAYTVIGLLLTYAVVFSIAGTVVIFKAYNYIQRPIKDVVAYRTHNPVQTKYMVACLEELSADTNAPDTLIHSFIPLDSISPNLVEAVIAAEDDGFYLHPGIDIPSILAAVEYNKTQGKNSHGASTLTQQMAKNLFLSGERTFERKFRELLYAFLMERYLGKRRILELYMNYAQWGKNIFGCEAACRVYFKKSATRLTRGEAARLAAVLAKPSSLTPHSTKSVFMGKRIAVIAQNLYLHRAIDDSGYFELTGTLPPPKPDKDSIQAGSNGKKRTEPDTSERNTF